MHVNSLSTHPVCRLGISSYLHLANVQISTKFRLEEKIEDLVADSRFVVEEQPGAGASREPTVPVVSLTRGGGIDDQLLLLQRPR